MAAVAASVRLKLVVNRGIRKSERESKCGGAVVVVVSDSED